MTSSSGPREDVDREDEGSDGLQPGDVVGRYEVLERIGAGAMGVVYRAHDPQLDRAVALKLLRAEPTTSDHAHEDPAVLRMLREAKSVAQIRHPAVVVVYDAGIIGTRVFIAMECLVGESFGSWLHDGSRPWPEVLDLLIQAGRGLEAAHAVGLVHRDFKPENVFVEPGGRARVLDFGLARRAYDSETGRRVADELGRAPELTRPGLDSQRVTQTGALIGTPAYMAPEQYLHNPLDGKTDQFAFCVTAFEGLFGYRPYSGKTYAELTLKVLTGRIDDPPAKTEVPSAVTELLLRGLSVDPGDRYESMGELLARLDEVRGEPRAKFWARSMVLGVAAVALLGVGGFGLAFAGSGSSREDRPGALPVGGPARRPPELPKAEVVTSAATAAPALVQLRHLGAEDAVALLRAVVPGLEGEGDMLRFAGPPLGAEEAAVVNQIIADIDIAPRHRDRVLSDRVFPVEDGATESSSRRVLVIAADTATQTRLISRVRSVVGEDVAVRKSGTGLLLVVGQVDAMGSVETILLPSPQSAVRFRQWCFANERMGGEEVCRATKRACASEAETWLGAAGEGLCRGKR